MNSAMVALPKIELHEHLDGSLRISTILELATQNQVRLPAQDYEGLKQILVPGPSSLEIYLRAFAVTVSVLQTAPALQRVARETVEDWHADGVVYGEVRFAPELHTAAGLRKEEAVEAVLKGLEEGTKATGVEARLILASMRSAPPTLDVVQLVKTYRHNGVVAFDIAGAEAPFPPSLHRQAYEFAAENYLNTTCHAGEVTGPAYIREALLACRSLRIGHGTQLLQEWSGGRFPGEGTLSAWIRDRHIPLELCVTSNLQTKASATAQSHPLDAFRKAGIAVTVCTDNRLVSDTSLSRELELAASTWNWTADQLRQVRLNALEAAFCTPALKSRLLAKYFA